MAGVAKHIWPWAWGGHVEQCLMLMNVSEFGGRVWIYTSRTGRPVCAVEWKVCW
jgi:hypothetical protein